MRIGIIGVGSVGTTLGASWQRAGHTIVYGVRDPAKTPPGATGVPTSELAAGADVLVLTTQWSAASAAVSELGDLGGKPLIDVTNPIGPGFTLAVGHTTSGAEQLAAVARNGRVVKAFNTTGLENMAQPRYGDRPLVMPLAADDRGALELAARLATDLGFEAVPLPGLVHARELEPFGLLWIRLALQLGYGRDVGFGIDRRRADDRAPAVTTSQARAIAIVGGGHIGGALARGWQRAGHAVTVATRSDAGAVAGAEVVVLATPASAVPDVLATVGGLDGKIVIDCTNAIARGQLEVGGSTSSSEELAARIPRARVVRAFNQQGAEILENPVFGGVPAAAFVAADDAGARQVVLGLSRDLGLDAVDTGALSSARYLDRVTLLWITMAKALGTRAFGISLRRRTP